MKEQVTRSAIDYENTAKLLGIFFLTVMVSWSLGFWIIGDVLNKPDYLEITYPNRHLIFIGLVFELIDVGAILGIMVLMFPLMRLFSERMALWYFGLRLLECVLLMLALVSVLIVMSLSREYLSGTTESEVALESMGDLWLAFRNKWVQLLIPLFYGPAAILIFYFFYRVPLIPRFLSLAGLVGGILVLISIPLDYVEFDAGGWFGLLMGLVELMLGFWLLIKGFKPKVQQNQLKRG